MHADFWRYLHDGGIDTISGTIPGTITLDISIQYLRNQFPGQGEGFHVSLFNCWRVEYQEYDQEPTTDFDAIVAAEPEILGLQEGSGPVVVNCVMGVLKLSYESASISLDSGEAISFEELATASAEYWDAWSRRNK